MLTLLCLYLPPHHVLKEEVKWTGPQLGRGGWRLSLKKLVRGVIKERNKAWDKAKRLYAEYEAGVERQEAGKGQGGLRMVKKNLAHGIRYLMLGRALAERGAIDDFAAANHYYHQLMAHRGDLECSGDNDDKSSAPTVTGWDRWEARYRPVYQQLERQFRELVESEIGGAVAQQLRREEACRQQQRQWPAVVDYLRESVAAQQVTGRDDTDAALESALSALTRVFAIQISRHPQSSRLYHFRYDREDSPLSLELTRECNGLILEIGRVVAAAAAHDDNEGLRVEVACRPPRRSYNASRRSKEPTDEVLQRLDWSRVKVHDLLQGSTIFLYRGGAGWLMSTPRSVDAEVEWLGATTTPPSLAQQFWRAWQRHGCRLPDDLSSQRRTFVFKLWQRNNDLGSEHGELMFVGASDAGDDAAVELAERHGWPYVATLRPDLTPDGDATSDGGGAAERQQLVLRRLRRDLMALDPWRDPRKGLIVSGPSHEEADDVRVKFVSPQHAVLKRLRRAGRGEMPKDSVELDALMLDMVRTNDCHEDLLAAFPHLRARYLEVADDYHQVCGHIQAAFDAVASVARDQKAFAQGAAAHKRHKTVLLQMRKEGYANVREYLFAQSLPGVVYILGRCSTRPSWRGQQQSNK